MADAKVVDSVGTVHIDAPGTGSGNSYCQITGETYQNKEAIKDANYGRTDRRFNDGVWECLTEGASEVVACLLNARVGVTCDPWVVIEGDFPAIFQSHARSFEAADDEKSFIYVEEGGKKIVSKSQAKDMAMLANFDSVEEFSETFNIQVLPDEEAEKLADG